MYGEKNYFAKNSCQTWVSEQLRQEEGCQTLKGVAESCHFGPWGRWDSTFSPRHYLSSGFIGSFLLSRNGSSVNLAKVASSGRTGLVCLLPLPPEAHPRGERGAKGWKAPGPPKERGSHLMAVPTAPLHHILSRA